MTVQILFIIELWDIARNNMADSVLSYSNIFNQQKIVTNSSQEVIIPNTAGVLTTVLTVATTETVTPTARVFVEFSGRLAPIYSSVDGSVKTIVKNSAFQVYFNALNSLIIAVDSSDTYTATIYYRIYKDGAPT